MAKAATSKLSDKPIRDCAELFKIAGDPTRCQVLLLLEEAGEKNVGELCRACGGMSHPAMSHHLSLMRVSQVLDARRDGKTVYYSLAAKGKALARAASLLGAD
jgi:DNA-binding transcriptional ArsR family regulator